jgi:phage pi2 protein 07
VLTGKGPTPSAEWDGPCSSESYETVEVPETELLLSNDDYAELRRRVNPLQESEYNGVDLYMQTLAFIAKKL